MNITDIDLYRLSELTPPALLSAVLYFVASAINISADRIFEEKSKGSRVLKGLIPFIMIGSGAALYPWIYDRDIVLDVYHPNIYAAMLGAGIGGITVAIYEAKKGFLKMITKQDSK